MIGFVTLLNAVEHEHLQVLLKRRVDVLPGLGGRNDVRAAIGQLIPAALHDRSVIFDDQSDLFLVNPPPPMIYAAGAQELLRCLTAQSNILSFRKCER